MQVNTMKPYTIMLDDESIERLKRMAETEMKTEDQFVARLLEKYAIQSGHERPPFAMEGAGRGPGGSVADIPEDELLKGFGE